MNKKNIFRCFGGECGTIYANYHDHEWGIPLHNDQKLFEMLVLEGAQAGLNWETILKKRENYREVFNNFNVKKVAAMSDAELERQLENPKIIRNRLKVFSARKNAQAVLQIQKEFKTFDHYLWSFVDFKPKSNSWKNAKEVPTETKESNELSKALKKRGMSFVGPTIMYAFMQAVGMVNDHLTNCFRYQK